MAEALVTAKTFEEIVDSALRRIGHDPSGMSFSDPQQDIEILAKEYTKEVILQVYDVYKEWDFGLTKTTYSWPAGTVEKLFTDIDDSITDIDMNSIRAIFLSSTYNYKQLTPKYYDDYKAAYGRGEILTSKTGTPQYFSVFDKKLIIWPSASDTITIHYQPSPLLPALAADTITAVPAKYHDIIIDGVTARLAEQIGDDDFPLKQQIFQTRFNQMQDSNKRIGKRKGIRPARMYIR